MPTNTRYRTRGAKATPDADLINVLCGGTAVTKDLRLFRIRYLLCTRHTPPAADQALAAWHAVRIGVLQKWITTHPGTRPLAWWRYEAPTPHRRIVEGRGRLLPGDPLICGWPENLIDRTSHVVIESQASYLKRHKLLSPEEERALPPEAFTPAAWTNPDSLSRSEKPEKRSRT